MASRKRIILVLLVSSAAAAVGAMIWPREREPTGQVRARSADALSHYGSGAGSAVPQLLKYRDDADPWARQCLSNALYCIAPETLQTNLPPRNDL